LYICKTVDSIRQYFRATCNEKLRHIVSKELASINANLQAMREELNEITTSSNASSTSGAGMALFLASNNNNVSSRHSSKQYGFVQTCQFSVGLRHICVVACFVSLIQWV
jgi:hypothetical protein